MSAPSITIRLSIEDRLRLSLDCISESEERRLVDWLSAKPEYLDLITRAIELADEERAA